MTQDRYMTRGHVHTQVADLLDRPIAGVTPGPDEAEPVDGKASAQLLYGGAAGTRTRYKNRTDLRKR
jgi:hypothetical protein